jgi:hypothetical protein
MDVQSRRECANLTPTSSYARLGSGGESAFLESDSGTEIRKFKPTFPVPEEIVSHSELPFLEGEDVSITAVVGLGTRDHQSEAGRGRHWFSLSKLRGPVVEVFPGGVDMVEHGTMFRSTPWHSADLRVPMRQDV